MLGVAVVTVFVLVQRQGRGHRVAARTMAKAVAAYASPKPRSDRDSDGSGSGSHRLVHVSPLDRDVPGDCGGTGVAGGVAVVDDRTGAGMTAHESSSSIGGGIAICV